MLIPERQARLRELIERQGLVDLESLAASLGVSQSTVRRDIERLVADGLVTRTHGGVIWNAEKTAGSRPYAFDQRLDFQADAKRRIAAAARALVQPGQTILLDGGTTTLYFARELLGMRLQVVTNSLPIASLFQNDEHVELVLTGGLAYPRYGVLLGPMAESALGGIHTQSLFLSVAGVHEGHLYNQNLLLVQAEQRMMDQAQQVVLLVDQSKFGQQALVRLCGLDRVHVIVTDAPPPADDRRRITDAGSRLVIAGESR